MICAASLLSAWELCLAQSNVRRALTLLTLLLPEAPWSDLAALTLGERDSHLLRLREQLFGSRLCGSAVCPKCRERLELEFTVQDVGKGTGGEVADHVRAKLDGLAVIYRLPSSADLLAVEAQTNPTEARRQLVQRCIVSVRCEAPGDEVSDVAATPLPESLITLFAENMQQADPQADVELALTCPACQHGWAMPFDIAAYLWNEVNDWALRALREVHVLASAYGWREADILAMTARRRGLYLQMLGA